jgi:hypothetical protein
MGKAGRKKKRDGGVLRAEDIVPPYGEDAGRNGSPQKAKTGGNEALPSQKKGKQVSAGKSPVAGRTPAKGRGAGTQDEVRQGSEIPTFDLGQQILAEQRKVAAVRRMGPGMRGAAPGKIPQVQPASGADGRPGAELSERDPIVAEIVARDIGRLCRGDAAGV